jgi:hypothetical protein
VLGQGGVDVQVDDVPRDLNHAEDVGRVEAIQRCDLDRDLADIVVLGHRLECDPQRCVDPFVDALTPAGEVLPHLVR